MMNGRARIAAAFAQAQQTQTAALMPYFTLGYPDRETSLAVIEAIAPYSDLLELGVPFSDPLADGPTIQRSAQIALENGTSTAVCLEMALTLRRRGVQTPIMLMGYVNPVMAYGEARYVQDAAQAGVDGFIIPDLPPEEAGELDALAQAAGQALIYFLAPTSHPQRIADVVSRAAGFIYLVSVTGVTGARAGVGADLGAFVARVRAQQQQLRAQQQQLRAQQQQLRAQQQQLRAQQQQLRAQQLQAQPAVPLAVGFGISTPKQAGQVGQLADGVIVGSALINAVNGAADKPGAAAEFVRSLRKGLAR